MREQGGFPDLTYSSHRASARACLSGKSQTGIRRCWYIGHYTQRKQHQPMAVAQQTGTCRKRMGAPGLQASVKGASAEPNRSPLCSLAKSFTPPAARRPFARFVLRTPDLLLTARHQHFSSFPYRSHFASILEQRFPILPPLDLDHLVSSQRRSQHCKRRQNSSQSVCGASSCAARPLECLRLRPGTLGRQAAHLWHYRSHMPSVTSFSHHLNITSLQTSRCEVAWPRQVARHLSLCHGTCALSVLFHQMHRSGHFNDDGQV